MCGACTDLTQQPAVLPIIFLPKEREGTCKQLTTSSRSPAASSALCPPPTPPSSACNVPLAMLNFSPNAQPHIPLFFQTVMWAWVCDNGGGSNDTCIRIYSSSWSIVPQTQSQSKSSFGSPMQLFLYCFKTSVTNVCCSTGPNKKNRGLILLFWQRAAGGVKFQSQSTAPHTSFISNGYVGLGLWSC